MHRTKHTSLLNSHLVGAHDVFTPGAECPAGVQAESASRPTDQGSRSTAAVPGQLGCLDSQRAAGDMNSRVCLNVPARSCSFFDKHYPLLFGNLQLQLFCGSVLGNGSRFINESSKSSIECTSAYCLQCNDQVCGDCERKEEDEPWQNLPATWR